MALRHLRMWNPPGSRRSGARFPGYASAAGGRKKKATPKKKASASSSSTPKRRKAVAKANPQKKTLKKTSNGRYMYGGKFVSAEEAAKVRKRRAAARKAAAKRKASRTTTTTKSNPSRKKTTTKRRRPRANPSTTKRRSTTVARKKRSTKQRAAPKRRRTTRRNPPARKRLSAAHRRKISLALKRRYRGAKKNPRGVTKTASRLSKERVSLRPKPRAARKDYRVRRTTYTNKRGGKHYRFRLFRPASNDWMANLKNAVSTALPVFGGLMVSRVGGALLQKYVFEKNDSLKAHGHLLAPAALLMASAFLGPKLKLSPKMYNGLAMGAVMGLADAVIQKYVAPALTKAEAGETSKLIGKAITGQPLSGEYIADPYGAYLPMDVSVPIGGFDVTQALAEYVDDGMGLEVEPALAGGSLTGSLFLPQ